MVVELLEYVGTRLKELNPYVEAYAVNALRLANGKVGKLSSKIDFEYVGISDLNKAGFYIRMNGKPRYTQRKARTSAAIDYDLFAPIRLVFYSIDSEFEGSRIENKLTNDLIKMNFSGYSGNAGSPKFVIVQSSYDAISVFEEETGIKFSSNERPVIVSIDANLRLILGENDCNNLCNVYEILCGQTSPPAPLPDGPQMQTFCQAVEACPVITDLDDRVTELENADSSGIISTFIAGETLGGQRAVWLNNGKVFLFDPSNLNCQCRYVGITISSASQDEQVKVQSIGLFNNNSLGLTQGNIYYAGSAGVLTDTPPFPVEQMIGVAETPNSLYLYEFDPIETA